MSQTSTSRTERLALPLAGACCSYLDWSSQSISPVSASVAVCRPDLPSSRKAVTMGSIDWKSFFMGVIAVYLWRYVSVSLAARVG
jgi:hypothetical protein